MSLEQYGPDGRQYLVALAERLAYHRREADAARADLIAKVRDLHGRGLASEYVLADLCGVQRSTIRAWLGK